MADKISTLVLTVDLDCKKCCKKISKTLCKFHEIERQILDEKLKKVTVSGRFNPECLIKELYRKLGCKIIKGYEIPKPEPDGDKKTKDETGDAKKSKDGKGEAKKTKDEKGEVKKTEPYKQPIYVGQVYVAPICICGRPCGGACTWRHRGWCWPYDDEIRRRREGSCSPCREGRPCEGICRRRDNCCSPCREGRPICTKGGAQYGNSYRFFSEEDSMCKPM